MIKKLNSKIRPLLDIYEKLKDSIKLANIKIPKIVTCGMQSHGKSSTLESITEIQLPSKAETCTICPIKICLRETKDKPYYRIKIEDEEYTDDDSHLTNFNEIKNKIDKYQDKVRKALGLKNQQITEKKVIQIEVFKKNIPNLNLYDLPGVTFVEGIKKEAESIYEKCLEDEDTIVLLILNGSDDLTNSCVIEWMKKIKNYKNRFIPIVAKADLIKNFPGKFKQLQIMKLNNKPCLVINKNKEIKESKNWTAQNEIDKIKEIIPNIEEYPVNLGKKNLINELIKIQYNIYKENFRDIVENIKREIRKNKSRLEELPQDFDLKEDFCDSFIDIFEQQLTEFSSKISDSKKGPAGNLLKQEMMKDYREYIVEAKQKLNEFFSFEFCEYITENIKQINSDKITILEDDIPFKLLIIPKIKEFLDIFKDIISQIYEKIIKTIKSHIDISFRRFINLKIQVKELYDEYSKNQYDLMMKFYEEIYTLETNNIYSFDPELNTKCNTLTRKILHFIYKKLQKPETKQEIENINNTPENNKIEEKNEIETKEEEPKEDEPKEEEPKKPTIQQEEPQPKNNEEDDDNNDDDENIIDASEIKISDSRNDIINGKKNINKLSLEKFINLTEEIIDKLSLEMKSNKNLNKRVKNKFKQYQNHRKQIIGIINNYEIQNIISLYDNLGCIGRTKLSYLPEGIFTFDERIEENNLNFEKEYEFVPGFQYIRNEDLNNFINLFRNDKISPKTANTVIKMAAYIEVMINRVIDIIFLAIKNNFYDYLTNDKMINHIRNTMHKLINRMDFDRCKKLLEVNKEVAEEIKECKKKISILTSSLTEIEKAHEKFYKDDPEIQEDENEKKVEENQEEIKEEEKNENNSDNEEN